MIRAIAAWILATLLLLPGCTCGTTEPPPAAVDVEPEAVGAEQSVNKKKRKKKRKKKNRKKRKKKKPISQHKLKDGTAGRYNRAADAPAGPKTELDKELEALEAIGYVAGSQPATGSGVTVYDAERTQAGLNFVVSAHAAEASLMDMKGTVLHTWKVPFKSVFPDKKPRGKGRHRMAFWRGARLLPNGDLIVIYSGLGVARLDKDSKVLWANGKLAAHHESQVAANGDVWVLTRKARPMPHIHPKKAILEDFLSVLDGATGKEKRRISLVEAYEKSEFKPHFDARVRKAGDVLHTNALEFLDGRLESKNPAFKKGNILLSMKHTHTAVVLDPDTGVIIWSSKGDSRHPHDPGVQPDGSLLMFDNRGPLLREKKSESRIVELDPAGGEDKVLFRGSDSQPFYSRTCGTVRKLTSGHLLITESDNGRVFELDADGKMVWEFHNPHRAGDKQEFVASIFDLERLPLDYGAAWRSGAH